MSCCVFRRTAQFWSMICLDLSKDTSAWDRSVWTVSELVGSWPDFDCCSSQEVVQSQVLEAKVFHSPYGTGIAIVTGSSRFTLATNIEDLKLRRLPEVPGKVCELWNELCQITLLFPQLLIFVCFCDGQTVMTVFVCLPPHLPAQVSRENRPLGSSSLKTDRPKFCCPSDQNFTSLITRPALLWWDTQMDI